MNILTARFRARGARRFVGYFRTIYGFQRRGICGIIRQLSRLVRFRFVLHIFFSNGLYPDVFRSVFFCWNNLISAYIAYVFRFLDLPSLKLISRFGRLCDKVFTVLSYSLKPITGVSRHAICRGIRFHTFFGHFSMEDFSGVSCNILLEV